MARQEARRDSGIDLLVKAPEGTSSFDFIKFKQLTEQVLCRQIDLVEYGGLKPTLDDDIRREAVCSDERQGSQGAPPHFRRG